MLKHFEQFKLMVRFLHFTESKPGSKPAALTFFLSPLLFFTCLQGILIENPVTPFSVLVEPTLDTWSIFISQLDKQVFARGQGK